MVTSAPRAPGGGIPAPPDDLCLGYINTLVWRGTQPPQETLHGIADLLAWTDSSTGLDPAIAASFAAWWHAHPAPAATAFTAAIELRETLFRLFGAAEPAGDDLARFNAALGAAVPRHRLGIAGARYVWQADHVRFDAAALLSPVLWSAADLLAGPRRDRVRFCANPKCRWAFLDDSKSGNRRWCSMSACGNRAKAQRHYQKHRQTA